jgi:hypothetical protein
MNESLYPYLTERKAFFSSIIKPTGQVKRTLMLKVEVAPDVLAYLTAESDEPFPTCFPEKDHKFIILESQKINDSRFSCLVKCPQCGLTLVMTTSI